MNKLFKYSIFLFITFLYGTTQAQSLLLTFQEPDQLVVCGQDSLFIQLQNLSLSPLNTGTIIINLPTGILYIPGSVTGATENDVTNPQSLVFNLPTLAPGASIPIQVQLTADCAAAAALNSGDLFFIQSSVQSNIGSTAVNNIPVPIETGLMLISSVNDVFMSGEKGDTLKRIICFKNTRLGGIRNLFFEDSHDPGIQISLSSGVIQTNTSTELSAVFDAGLYQTIGDGDGVLENGETACITETIVITDCGIPESTNQSKLRLGWGCGMERCQYDSLDVNIHINESTKVPELSFSPIWTPPLEQCAQLGATAGVRIENLGSGKAENVLVQIQNLQLDGAGIDLSSFRYKTTAGTFNIQPNIFKLDTICDIPIGKDVSIILPLIPAKDSVTLLFDYKVCADPCQQVLPGFNVNYFYTKPCPVGGFVSQSLVILPDLKWQLDESLIASLPGCLESGNTYSFLYKVSSKHLSQQEGILKISFDVPRSLSWNDSCAVTLSGVNPTVYSITPGPDQTTKVDLQFPLPLPGDTLFMPFCLRYVCDSLAECIFDTTLLSSGGNVVYYGVTCPDPCLVRLSHRALYCANASISPSCAISDCGENLIGINKEVCGENDGNPPGDTVIIYPIYPAKVSIKKSVYRKNYGFKDLNDDRIADSQALTNANEADKNRYLPGDTMRLEFCMSVDSGGGVKSFPRYIAHMIYRGDMSQMDQDSFSTQSAQYGMMDEDKIIYLGDSVRIKYSNGTQVQFLYQKIFYESDNRYIQINQVNTSPVVQLDEVAYKVTGLDLLLDTLFSQGQVPKNTLDKGDSLFVWSDFKFSLNFTPPSTNTPDPPLIGFRTTTNFPSGNFSSLYGASDYTSCQYSGFREFWTSNSFTIKPCEPSSQSKPFRYGIRIARPNMFPKEVRPLSKIIKYKQTIPGGLSLLSANLKYLVLQDSVPWLSNIPLPFSLSAGAFNLDFSPVFSQILDEGFSLETTLQFNPDCTFSKPDSSVQTLTTGYPKCFYSPEKDTVESFKKNNLGYLSSVPNITAASNDTLVYVLKKDFEAKITLKNTVIPPAPNVWLKIVSLSGQTNDFKVTRNPQQSVLPGQNNLFQAGNFAGFDAQQFTISGRAYSCETDTLLFIYGWNCTPVTGVLDYSCAQDTFIILLKPVRPELELDILKEPGVITLCDTSDYFEIKLYNAKTGFAYDLSMTSALPAGIQIVSGSCEISYPEGAPYVSIADPTLIGPDYYQWNINNLLPGIGQEGLPGEQLYPQNTILIRFRVLAECGFVANTQPVFGGSGTEACGRPTNQLNKPGNPLTINGLNSTYGVIISLQPLNQAPVFCGDEKTFKVQLVLLGTPGPGDSIYVQLPQHAIYVPGSYQAGQNAPNVPPTLENPGFRLPIPNNLMNGSILEFNFSVQFTPGAGCTNELISVQTRVQTSAFCQSSGANCSIYIATGDATYPVEVQPQSLQLLNGNIQVLNNSSSVQVNVLNAGTSSADNITVQIWNDVDGNGVLSPADVLLGALQSNTPLAAGAVLTLNGPINGAVGIVCQLLAVLPATENCACQSSTFLINTSTIQYAEEAFCELNPIPVGLLQQPGFVYNWTPAAGIACTTCPGTTFTPPSNTPSGTIFELTLTETTPACTLNHVFKLGYYGVVPSTSPAISACIGELVVLSVSPNGSTYQWQGPGISSPTIQNQQFLAQQSAIYTVTVTNANGCTGTATTTLTTFLSDTLLLPEITTCMGQPVNILNQVTDIAGVYSLTLQNIHGCDSIIKQALKVIPGENTIEALTFCLGDSLFALGAWFKESGQLCKTFQNTQGCDSTHCVTVTALDPPQVSDPDTLYGTVLTNILLNGPDNFNDYTWIPNIPNCIDCQDITVQFDTAGYYEYTLIVGDDDGCSAQITYRVVIFPPCDARNVKIPNAFTPNGDSVNDVFRVVPFEGTEVIASLTIYDRWGEKVYSNTGNVFWNGTIDGQPAPMDVYVYIIEVECSGTRSRLVGDVTLIR
jgi:gliding motility-associated-like protein